MEISLTKEQYRTLIEMVYMGEWMINATRVKTIKKFEEMEQHIASFAKTAGLEDLIEFDAESKTYYPTKGFEESIDRFKDEYDNETFWEELVARLGQRDLEREFGGKLEKMSREEVFKLRYDIEEVYQKEFSGRGIERVEVVRATGRH
ncbi:MAG TPA: hypothetical protein DCM05_10070 [Elusimicrobia bacterium]|nr:hypothetical protein [Elusimicrobiota bacterium]